MLLFCSYCVLLFLYCYCVVLLGCYCVVFVLSSCYCCCYFVARVVFDDFIVAFVDYYFCIVSIFSIHVVTLERLYRNGPDGLLFQ